MAGPASGPSFPGSRGRFTPTYRRSSGSRPGRVRCRWGNPGDPGYLGLSHAPFTPFRTEAQANATRNNEVPSGDAGLSLDEKVIIPERLSGRRSLLGQLDELRRTFDHDEAMQGMDSFTQRAFEVLGSRRVFEALDLTREDPRLRARYGVGDMRNEDDGPPCCMDHFLMARRLVEAGARVVTISFGRWDTHGQNFRSCRTRIPKLDMALSTLVEDLHLRGLDKDVSVVVWGEFGRTPKINKNAGRDHWPPVNFALLAGGGMRHRPGHRLDRQASRLRQGSARLVSERLRHALPQPRHRPRHRRCRSKRPAHVLARRPAADPRAGLKSRRGMPTASADSLSHCRGR